jgi:flagellin-like hook-associated protein FlgL
MAMNTARNLNNTYDRLSSSVQRLSSGLRINSAADDAAGLAIRELMRADIATMQQGIRNAADAISMIQTADGAMAVIDEKLTRMKELAEQAATGTYTTLQREIINSEYQAMAAEIDRIAAATNFNGVKLLDGSITNLHGGQGMKIHFGVGNNPEEDYYFLTMGDVRATSQTGLQIGGDAKNDIWGQGAAGAAGLAGPGCCTAGYDSLDGIAGFKSGQTFAYGYNWDWMEDDDPDLLTGKYLAGRYTVNSTDSLQDLINKVNKGSQSRVGVQLDASALAASIKAGGTAAVCVGEEAYIFGSAAIAGGTTIEPAVEGVSYNYLANGNYLGQGFRANMLNNPAGYGFGLTANQISALEKAGIDLSALGLTSAKVTASASSLVSSAQARTKLLLALTQAWNALGLNGYSSLTTQSGVVSGFTIDADTIKASANASNVSDSTMNATILNDGSLRIHTGVYADENGNWTDDERIAKALNLQEVVFTVANVNKASYMTELVAAGFKSDQYLMNANSSIAITIGAKGLMDTAAVDLTNFTSAVINGPMSATGVDAAASSAALLAKLQAAWTAKYNAVATLLGFTVNAGTGTVVGKTDAQIITSAGAGNFTAGLQNANTTIDISANVWIDATGNYTTDQSVANALGGFTRLVYTFETDTTNAGIFTDVLVNGVSIVGGSDPSFGTLPVTATNVTALIPLINASIEDQIATAQGSSTDKGLLAFTNPNPNLYRPTEAELDHQKTVPKANPVSTNLTATVDIAGTTSALTGSFGPALTTLPRATTTLNDLVTATSTALAQILANYQNNGLTRNYVSIGRIVTDAATPPQGPNGVADVDSLTQSAEFHSGVLDRSLATGTYADSGYVFNSATGYGLSSSQLALINMAGLDLSKLSLYSAIVSTSASSNVSSASARAMLLDKLNAMWTALALGNYSALTISAGVVTGYSAITSADLMASATAGATFISAGNTYIQEQKYLVVHTGIYSDDKGNWTDNASLAKDLGLSEITYRVENNNKSWFVTSAEFKSPKYAVSGTMLVTCATIDALGLAGITIAGLASATITATGSGKNHAEASANLLISAQNLWAAKYQNALSSLTFDVGNSGHSILEPEFSLFARSATVNNCSDNSPTGIVIVGSTLTVHTGIYADGAGNWTDNSALAQVFGFNEVKYTILNDGTDYVINGGLLTNATYTPAGIGTFVTTIRDETIKYIANIQGTLPTNSGKLSLGPQVGPLAPDKADLDAVKTAFDPRETNTKNVANLGKLDITINIAGVTTAVFDLWHPPTVSASETMTSLASILSAEIEDSLRYLQSEALTSYTGMGRIWRTNPTPPDGPDALTDLKKWTSEDIYKKASSAQTVTKTGIVSKYKFVTVVASAGTSYYNSAGVSNFGAWALASAINHNANSQFWAMVQPFNSDGVSADMVYIFTKEGGNFNSLLACDVADGDVASREALDAISFENTETDKHSQSGTNFSLGGLDWGTFKPIQTKAGQGKEVWNLTLHGLDVGKERDLWIAAMTNGVNEIKTPGLTDGIINGLDRYSFVEIQNADNGQWTGAEVRTQSSAQEALDAINDAMERKDKVRADIGALQNRLENTITNLEIQVEALQQSESRISDVDMATEMTEFVRNQVLAQAAISMLTQANSLPQMALSLLNG